LCENRINRAEGGQSAAIRKPGSDRFHKPGPPAIFNGWRGLTSNADCAIVK
jgi:hypothetical protein